MHYALDSQFDGHELQTCRHDLEAICNLDPSAEKRQAFENAAGCLMTAATMIFDIFVLELRGFVRSEWRLFSRSAQRFARRSLDHMREMLGQVGKVESGDFDRQVIALDEAARMTKVLIAESICAFVDSEAGFPNRRPPWRQHWKSFSKSEPPNRTDRLCFWCPFGFLALRQESEGTAI